MNNHYLPEITEVLFTLCDLKDYNESKRSDQPVISTILGRRIIHRHNANHAYCAKKRVS